MTAAGRIAWMAHGRKRFATHDDARKAAELAAREQTIPGEDTDISYPDSDGKWRVESTSGKDRPEPEVKG